MDIFCVMGSHLCTRKFTSWVPVPRRRCSLRSKMKECVPTHCNLDELIESPEHACIFDRLLFSTKLSLSALCFFGFCTLFVLFVSDVLRGCPYFSGNDENVEIILINPPYEPLYIQTTDGEASIPRRVFYDICKAYQPYKTVVVATFVRLLSTFTVVAVIFLLLIQFQVFDEFSKVNTRVY